MIEEYQEFQKICKYREWTSFGHYTCEVTKKGCPRSRHENCPCFKKEDKEMEFYLTKEDVKKYRVWLEEHKKVCSVKNAGAIGGRITFQFTPTSLGLITIVTCICGEELNLTDYEGW